MQLHEILENGPIVYAAPVGDNKLGEVYSLSGSMLRRWVWHDKEHEKEYRAYGSRHTHDDYDTLDMETIVEQAELWHASVEE